MPAIQRRYAPGFRFLPSNPFLRRLTERYLHLEGYDISDFTQEGRVLRTFEDGLPVLDGGRVLDMGCNSGETTTELVHLYPNSSVVGIDVVPALNHKEDFLWNRQDRKGLYLLADGYYPPFRAESFDAVFCMNNIYFCIHPDDFTGISSLVKESGYLLISGTERRFGGNDNYVILQKEKGKFIVQHQLVRETERTQKEDAQRRLDRLVQMFCS